MRTHINIFSPPCAGIFMEIEMNSMNAAQRLLAYIGADPIALLMPRSGRSPSNTKKGPGRKHLGRKKAED